MAVAKLFPYRDADHRLMFRGDVGAGGVSKFFPLRVGGKLLLRGQGVGGVQWGFPYRDASGRLMGRTVGGWWDCDCPPPSAYTVNLSGVTGRWLLQEVTYPCAWSDANTFNCYGFFASTGWGLGSWTRMGLVSGLGADLSGANGEYSCAGHCSFGCRIIYLSPWRSLGASTVSGRDWYHCMIPPEGDPPPGTGTWSDSRYLWIRMLVIGEPMHGWIFPQFGESQYAWEEPVGWASYMNQLWGIPWVLTPYDAGYFHSETCEIDSAEPEVRPLGGSVPSDFSDCQLNTNDYPYDASTIAATAVYGGAIDLTACPATIRVCIVACGNPEGCGHVRIADLDDNTVASADVWGCHAFENVTPGEYDVTVSPCVSTGGAVVHDWAMASGAPYETQRINVGGLSDVGLQFNVRPLFTPPAVIVSGIAAPACNGGIPNSTGTGWCLAGGAQYQIPANLLNGTWVLDTLGDGCGYTREEEFEGQYWAGCTPTAGTIHVKAKLYFGNRTIDGSNLVRLDMIDERRWIVYLEVSVNEELECLPTAWAYYVGQTTLLYPYTADFNVAYVLAAQGPGVVTPFTGSAMEVGVHW